jgi:hypothetical protein
MLLLRFWSIALLGCACTLGVAQASDWRDVIPPPEAFVVPNDLAVILANDLVLEQWKRLTTLTLLAAPRRNMVIARSQSTIYVAFAGTDPDDWNSVTNNLNAWLIDIDSAGFAMEGKVHFGFFDSVFGDDLHLTLTDIVQQALKGDSQLKVVVTGYSRGAGEATLYAAYLAPVLAPIRVSVLNIGSPRVGDSTFKSSLRSVKNLAVHRLVNDEDVVARVPPTSVGYRHVGHLIHLNGQDSKAYYQQLGSSTLRYAGVNSNDWKINLIKDDLRAGIEDHSSSEYAVSIALALQNREDFWPSAFEQAQVSAPVQQAQRKCCAYVLFWCRRWC